MRSRPLFRLQAMALLALTGALALPSHHHERPDSGAIVVDAGHHGHGTLIVDQGDRQTSELMTVALPAVATTRPEPVEASYVAAPAPAPRPLARGQPPPSDRPRAPPVSA